MDEKNPHPPSSSPDPGSDFRILMMLTLPIMSAIGVILILLSMVPTLKKIFFFVTSLL